MTINKNGSVQAVLLILIVLIVGGLVGGALVYLATTKNQEPAPINTRIVYPPGTNLPTFGPIVEIIKPAVVNVYTEQKIRNPYGGFRGFRSPFDDIFGDDFLRQFFGQAPRNYTKNSLGSGVLVDPAGYILTNNHVIDQADKVSVKLQDGTEYKGVEIIGRDPKTDLALLKISGKSKFPIAVLGDSDTMKVGDWVLAIGNPFGYSESVSHGIISGLGRHVGVAEYEDFIQTDAPINPGNSGGPLVNLKGEVIGINAVIATYPQTQTNIGIGFAIPSNLVKNVFTQLKTHGKVVRGWLGIRFQELSPEFAKEKFGSDKGLVVIQIVKGSPADKAGIQLDDFVTGFDGKKIATGDQFRQLVGTTKIGKTVTIDILRKKQPLSIKVTIGEMPAEVSNMSTKGAEVDLGLTVENVTPEIARKLHLDKTTGVIVTGVDEGSISESAGIQAEDVILELNNKPIKNIEDFKSTVNKLKKGDKIYLKIYRNGLIMYVRFQVE